MEYRRLGQAGVKVSPICLGAGVRGPLDEERFIRTIEHAIDLGCNFIDCSNNYGGGKSEPLLGRAIKGERDNLVITSKVFTRVGSGLYDQGLDIFDYTVSSNSNIVSRFYSTYVAKINILA